VTVPQSQNPAVVVTAGHLGLDFHQPEIPGAVMREAVGAGGNDEVCRRERVLDTVNQLHVRDRRPGFRGARSRNELNILAFNSVRRSPGNPRCAQGPVGIKLIAELPKAMIATGKLKLDPRSWEGVAMS